MTFIREWYSSQPYRHTQWKEWTWTSSSPPYQCPIRAYQIRSDQSRLDLMKSDQIRSDQTRYKQVDTFFLILYLHTRLYIHSNGVCIWVCIYMQFIECDFTTFILLLLIIYINTLMQPQALKHYFVTPLERNNQDTQQASRLKHLPTLQSDN